MEQQENLLRQHFRENNLEKLRELTGNHSMIFTDAIENEDVVNNRDGHSEIIKSLPDRDVTEVPESELTLPEFTAATYRIGGYEIRNAWAGYQLPPHRVRYQDNIPADESAINMIKERIANGNFRACKISNSLVNFISARHVGDGDFKLICTTEGVSFYGWHEYIVAMYTAKESEAAGDESESLWVLYRHVGPYYTDDKWYRFGRDGEIEEYKKK